MAVFKTKLYVILVIFIGHFTLGARTYGNNIEEREEIRIRGRVFCLNLSGQPLADCVEEPNLFGLRRGDGMLYIFLSKDPKVAMFKDPRVREKEIELTGWMREERVEIKNLWFVRDQGLVEFFFRCDVCNITSFSPGPCWCCREEFELRERPSHEP